MGFDNENGRVKRVRGDYMDYDVIVVGGGIAGLTSAAYLSKAGLKVLICEKEEKLGGLINSFDYKGFTFDGGIRAVENSGIVMPMFRQLGIDIPFVRSIVSVGLEDDIIKVETKKSLEDYKRQLKTKFPDNALDIDRITRQIKKIMKYMDILYGIDNPLFMDLLKNKKYLFFTIFPWLFKFIFTVNKINKLNTPVEEHLKSLTDNQALVDIIAQHFFTKTPTFFALSYFSLYLDYQYPEEGTGMIVDKMEEFIKKNDGEFKLSTKIEKIDPENHLVYDDKGNSLKYKHLIWAADLNEMYKKLNLKDIKNEKTLSLTKNRIDSLEKLRGGNSVMTVYMTTDLKPEYFNKICTGHFFYTPVKTGLNKVLKTKESIMKEKSKTKIIEWVKQYLDLTTFEISIPVLRNEKLAPKGKTGLIVSTLFDYDIVKRISDLGFYDEFKNNIETYIIEVLNKSIFKELKDNMIDHFSSTPLTIEKLTGNRDGAITGWAFTNEIMPVVHRMTKVSKSVLTTIPDIYKAGQWSYSPSGFPISIMTGKLAADTILKKK